MTTTLPPILIKVDRFIKQAGEHLKRTRVYQEDPETRDTIDTMLTVLSLQLEIEAHLYTQLASFYEHVPPMPPAGHDFTDDFKVRCFDKLRARIKEFST